MPKLKQSLEALALANLSTKKRGRKKGQLNKGTLDKMKVKKNLDQRFMRATDKIANAQIALASGLSFLYKVHTNEKGIRGRPELITEQSVIENYLAGDLKDEQQDFYYITTKEPNNSAIDSIMNRVHGKPTESLDVHVEVFSLKGLAEKRKRLAVLNENETVIDQDIAASLSASPQESTIDNPSDDDTDDVNANDLREDWQK